MSKMDPECDENCSFRLSGGKIIRNLSQLSQSLEEMEDSTFSNHVNSEKNDFSSWVNDVLSDEQLANDLRSANDRKEAQVTVLKRLVQLMDKD